MLFEEGRELVEPRKSDGPKTKKTEKDRERKMATRIIVLPHQFNGSWPTLVIKAHQQSALKTFIHSHNHFCKPIHSSAIVDSPKSAKSRLMLGFTPKGAS